MLSESMTKDIPGKSLDSIDVLEGLTEPAVTLLIAFKRLRDRTWCSSAKRENFNIISHFNTHFVVLENNSFYFL